MEASNNTPTDQRLTDLEIKPPSPKTCSTNSTASSCANSNKSTPLIREIADLKQQAPADGGVGGVRSLRDDLPPHF